VTLPRWLALAAVAMLPLLAVGCGNAEEADPTPVKTFKITPASGTREPTHTPSDTSVTPPAETPSPAATGTAGAGETSTAPSGEATTLQLVGLNTLFDETELTAPAGRIIIEFDNKDGGIVHNVHVFKGEDAEGEDIGATELEAGPIKQTLELNLEPGAYFYQCDAHIATMSGTLTVT